MPEGPQVVRSIVAVGAGFFAVQVLTLGADLLTGSEPRALWLTYNALLNCLAGYITAWLAVRSPVRHAFILSIILFVLTAVMAFLAQGSIRSEYLSAMVLLVVPATLLGGKLREMQVKRAG